MNKKQLLWMFSACICGTTAAQEQDKGQTELSKTLDEIVVTATGTAHKLKDVPVHTEVITRKELEALHANSMEEILSTLSPSFDFSRSSMGANLQLGGLGNSYVLILIDGKRIHGDVGGQNDFGLINPSRIERIEIVKGAASALYGSDAMAGVVNIITRKNKEDLLLEHTTRIGSYGEIRQFNTLQIRPQKWTLTTNFQLKHSDGWQNTTFEDPNRFEHPITNSVNKTVNRFTDGQLEQIVKFQPNTKHEWFAQSSLYYKRIYRPFGIPSYHTYDFQYRDIQTQIGGNHRITNSFRLKWDANYDSHAYFYLYKKETWETDFDANGKSYGLLYIPGNKGLQSNQQRFLTNLRAIYSIGAVHNLSAGAEYRQDWLRAPRRLERNEAYTNTAALYVQDEWNATERLNITAGLRLTYNSDFGAKLTPKISAKYALRNWNFRVNYSEGFKTPTLKEMHYRYVSQMDQMTLTLGKTNLKPQSNRYWSASIEYQSNHLSVSISSYLNRLDNLIALMLIPRAEAPSNWIITFDPNRVKQYRNVNKAKTEGIDLNLKYEWAKYWTWTLGYAYLNTRANQYNEETGHMDRVIIDGMAHHRVTTAFTWKYESKKQFYRLAIGLYGRLQSKRYYIDNGNGKPYQLWRLNTRHVFPLGKMHTIETNIGIDNLFNYYETTYHGLHYGTDTPGRTIYASVKWTFGKLKKN